jgi:hypothetical protein
MVTSPAEGRKRLDLDKNYRGYLELVLSVSHVSDVPPLAEMAVESPSWPDATAAFHDYPAAERPIELDLRGAAGFAQLRQMSEAWRALPEQRRHALLRNREIILPPRAVAESQVVVLPGGTVAVRGPDSMLVCDPVEAAIFNHAEVKHLRRVLRTRPDVSTLLHTANGVMLRQRVPKKLPPQAVTIVPNAARLPIRVSLTGPVLIQWGIHGAVARPLVPAPALMALAVSIAASPQVSRAAGLVHRGPVITSETWQAADAEDRCHLIAAALTDHLSDLVAETVCDELRFALMKAYVDGQESTPARIARSLAVLPTCFVADPASLPSAPPMVWQQAMAHIRGAVHPRVLLGMDRLTDSLAAIRGLRDTLEHAEVMAFDEDGEALPGGPVALHSDAALFQARKAGPRGRLGVAIPTPASPVDLYVLAYEVALLTGGRIIAVAPGWGFCHRVGPDGEETGNAGWFGMGAGLDEVDVVIGDIDLSA